MSTDLELSLYNARSRRHSVALTRIVGAANEGDKLADRSEHRNPVKA